MAGLPVEGSVMRTEEQGGAFMFIPARDSSRVESLSHNRNLSTCVILTGPFPCRNVRCMTRCELSTVMKFHQVHSFSLFPCEKPLSWERESVCSISPHLSAWPSETPVPFQSGVWRGLLIVCTGTHHASGSWSNDNKSLLRHPVFAK